MNTVLSISEIWYTAVNVFLFIVIFPTYLIFFRIILVRIPFRFFVFFGFFFVFQVTNISPIFEAMTENFNSTSQ